MNECILNEITRPDQNKSGHIMLSMRNGRIAEHPTVQRGKFILVNNEYIDDKNIEKKRKKNIECVAEIGLTVRVRSEKSKFLQVQT